MDMMKRAVCLLGMIFAAAMAVAGGLEFALKPKGLGQAGQFQFSVDGPAVNYFAQFLGDGFHVESSTDLKQWHDVELLKATDEETVFQDGGESTKSRFYRVRYEGGTSTWGIIRDRILGPNCAGCHSKGTTFAKQSNLILTPDAAYGQLVNRTSAQKAWPAWTKVFCWRKLRCPGNSIFMTTTPATVR